MNERIIQILISSFTKILIPGIKVTIPLTILSFTFGCIIALLLALVQVANVKGLKQFARFYIWIFRGTPLLVQLFIIFFGLPSIGIILDGDFPFRDPGSAGRTDRGRLHGRFKLSADDDPGGDAAGIPDRVPAVI